MMLKSIFMSVLTIASVATVNAQQLNIPQPSPNTNIRQAFATSFIELNYSRPSVRGRVVFGRGGLVAMGKVWRTGANAATTITFGEEVSVNGVKLPKRKYGLLTIPSASEWTIILSKDTTVTSASDYKQENDAVRFTVKPVKLPSLVETFTIDIANVRPKGDACDIRIMWEKTMVSFTVTADIDSKIMAQIDEAMKGEKKPYYAAARYYYDNGKDLKKALEWVDEAIKARPEAYWIVLLKAQIQFKLADYTGAIATAKQCAEIAKKDENDEYVKKAEAIVADSEKAKGK
jgi:hypothetical protein